MRRHKSAIRCVALFTQPVNFKNANKAQIFTTVRYWNSGQLRILELFAEHQIRDIPRPVNYANNDDFGIGETVIHRVVPVKANPQSARQIIPSGANLGLR